MNGFISNTVFQITAEPAQLAICCHKNNLTADLIASSGLFTVSVLGSNASQELISLFGYRSGRDVDKFASTPHTMTASGAPLVTQDCLAWFECRVTQSVDVGSHLLFTATILNGEMTDIRDEPLTYAMYRDIRKGKSPKNAPTYVAENEAPAGTAAKYRCVICGHVYDPAKGDPEHGIAAGTDFNDLAAEWTCPICGAGKENFEAII